MTNDHIQGPTDDGDRDTALARFGIRPDASLREAAVLIDRNGEGVAVVVDDDGRFAGIVTDGDIRRALLGGTSLDQKIGSWLEIKTGPGPGAGSPLVATPATPPLERLRMMEAALVRHLPLVDGAGMFKGMALLSEFGVDEGPGMRAVVMAGGFGKRVWPLTVKTPKPLLPMGDKPVIEHILDQLGNAGVRQVSVTTHYHAEQIRDRLGDGSAFGLEVNYTHEDEPLGTAGALGILEHVEDAPILVVNGDILTAVDFRAMLAFHREHKSDLTVGVRRYEFSVPFGVIQAEGVRVTRLDEKPSLGFFINAGVYVLEPRVLTHVKPGERKDMTDLIEELVAEGAAVTSFPIHEYWMDIGQLGDYERALVDVREGKLRR